MASDRGVSVLIVSKGHAYDHDEFLAMFADMAGITTTLVEQPAAQILLQPEHAGQWDTVLFDQPRFDTAGTGDFFDFECVGDGGAS